MAWPSNSKQTRGRLEDRIAACHWHSVTGTGTRGRSHGSGGKGPSPPAHTGGEHLLCWARKRSQLPAVEPSERTPQPSSSGCCCLLMAVPGIRSSVLPDHEVKPHFPLSANHTCTHTCTRVQDTRGHTHGQGTPTRTYTWMGHIHRHTPTCAGTHVCAVISLKARERVIVSVCGAVSMNTCQSHFP